VLQNIQVKVEGNKLVLTVDLSHVPGHEDVKFGLNVYRAKR